MENLQYGGGFGHCYDSEAPPPSSNNIVVSSIDSSSSSSASDHHHAVSTITNKVLRAKVASHPLFPQLLHNYIDCRKVGAPPEMAQQFDEIIIRGENNNIGVCQISPTFFGADPELDDFMEKYCDLLGNYKYELSRPFEEATAFLKDMETQLNSLICNGPSLYDNEEVTGSSSEKGFIRDEKERIIDERKRINNNEDRELKDNLLRRYSGYISSLKNEFSKNKKKERLPNEAKEILQAWWNIHFKWPYPTDADKVSLAEWTGLDQKQINNWFINQRKRHWKPSEEIQAAVFDGIYGPICISDDISE